MNKITVTGFSWVPSFAQELNRDLRVRWALEEVGLPYEVSLIHPKDRHSDAHRRKNPFGQIPSIEADGNGLFESGAILHYIAEEYDVLMPTDRLGRANTFTWMFAALNTVEPQIDKLSVMDLQHGEEEWVTLHRPAVVDEVKARLQVLSDWLQERDYLVERFTAADILMATVLRLIRHTDLVAQFPVVDTYLKRCEARPAFQKALERRLADFTHNVSAAA
jgi:glutathione S-transferase